MLVRDIQWLFRFGLCRCELSGDLLSYVQLCKRGEEIELTPRTLLLVMLHLELLSSWMTYSFYQIQHMNLRENTGKGLCQ